MSAKLTGPHNLDSLRYLAYGILYCLAFLGLGAVLGGHPLARLAVSQGLLLALALTFCAVILRRRREWEGSDRLFWEAFGLGLALWCAGQMAYTVHALTGHREWAKWYTMLTLCGPIGPVVALLAMPHKGVRQNSYAGFAIELVSYATLLGFIDAYFIMVPSVVPARWAVPQVTVFVLVEAQRFALFVGLIVSFAFAAGSPWRSTYARLTVGAGIAVVLRFAASNAIITNRYHEGSIYDLAWIVPGIFYLWAVLEAPPSSPDPPNLSARRCRWDNGLVPAIPVLVMPIVGFGLLRVQPLGDPGDTVRLLLTTMATVTGLGLLTARVSLQSEALQRSDSRLRLLAAATEQTEDLILITRWNGTFEHANEACLRALGYTRDELSHTSLKDLLEHGFEPMVDHIGREVRKKGVWRGTLIHRRKDGTTLPASSTVVALRNEEGRVTHFVGVQRDITEELKLRDQLVHTERLSAVGELVAGVAHEINNPLQTIIGCVELMIEEQKTTGQQLLDLQLVRQEASRAGQIVRNLLSFVRRGSPQRAEADLNQIARVTAALREQHLRDRNINLILDLHPGVLAILVNREEIQQIVLNLVLNAEHAIGDGPGTIVIRTTARLHAHRLEVVDDGPGVPPELRGRVFEPFFTTKDVGQGTGLGLSIAFGIATAHGGSLELVDPEVRDRRSEARPGACFVLTLPAHATVEAAQHVVEGLPPQPPASSRRRALIVEDEPPIRALLARLVARRAYDIVEASSCAEAKDAVTAHTYDLILCDVRLGDGNGAEVLRCVRERQPELGRRFVFVTGDIGSLDDADCDIAEMPLLSKPFTAADLDELLSTVEVPAVS